MPDRERRRRLVKYIDHLTFPQVLGELLKNHPDFKGRVAYTAAFPRDGQVQDLPRIVYRLISRVPGKEGKETLKPRLRPRSTWRNDDGTVSSLWAQWQTCIFQFDVCAESAQQADDLCWKLEQLVLDSIGLFQQLGAVDVLLDEQLEDALLPRLKDVQVRSIRFKAILEQVHVQTSAPIQGFVIRAFLPQAEDYEEVVRGANTLSDDPDCDLLTQTHISKIRYVSDAQPDGIARTEDYVEGVDFEVLYNDQSARTALRWLEPGRKPDPGAAYFVRYDFWTGFSTVSIPA